MPALVYLFAGLAPGAASIGTIVAFTTLQTRLFFPVQSLLSVGVDIQTSTALFDRVFEYLDLEVDIEPGTRDALDVRGEVHFDGVWFRYGDEWTLRDVDVTVPAGHAHRAGGRDRRGQDVARLPRGAAVRPRARRGAHRRHRPARADLRRAGRRGRRRLPGDLPLPRVACARTCASRGRTRPTRRSRTPPARPRSTTRSPRCRTATTPSSASAASASPAARSSGSRSPAPSCATRPCSCSTRPRRRSTSRPSAPSARRSSGSPRAARRSSSPTASRRSATPTRSSSSTTARSPSAAPTRSCSRSAVATPRSSPATKAPRRPLRGQPRLGGL